MSALLDMSSVSFRYGGRQVLDNMSLSLEAGRCTALIGPNGVGKTTLLRLAAGTLQPYTGNVFVAGCDLSRMSLKERSRLIALVPQHLEVPFDFTVAQIVEQGRAPYLRLLRSPTREDDRAVDRALDLADMSTLRHRIFNELSGGERQRVKIALGLAQEPRLLLLDEPTQNLDVGRQAELIDLLHHLRTQGITIVASIHDLHLVHDNFSMVHLLAPGHALLSGTPLDILTPVNLGMAFCYSPDKSSRFRSHFVFKEFA